LERLSFTAGNSSRPHYRLLWHSFFWSCSVGAIRTNTVRERATVEAVDRRIANILILVFMMLAVRIVSAGYFYYQTTKNSTAQRLNKTLAIAK
jgi:hypothetical protein